MQLFPAVNHFDGKNWEIAGKASSAINGLD